MTRQGNCSALSCERTRNTAADVQVRQAIVGAFANCPERRRSDQESERADVSALLQHFLHATDTSSQLSANGVCLLAAHARSSELTRMLFVAHLSLHDILGRRDKRSTLGSALAINCTEHRVQ